jgi:tagaturonate reductase
MNARNVKTIGRYFKKFGKAPKLFALGFAAYLLFEKSVKEENGQYFGQKDGQFYPINDDAAAYFHQKWQGVDTTNVSQFVEDVLKNKKLWDSDLTKITSFADLVTGYLTTMMSKGIKATLAEI